jgi:hypothetical protein
VPPSLSHRLPRCSDSVACMRGDGGGRASMVAPTNREGFFVRVGLALVSRVKNRDACAQRAVYARPGSTVSTVCERVMPLATDTTHSHSDSAFWLASLSCSGASVLENCAMGTARGNCELVMRVLAIYAACLRVCLLACLPQLPGASSMCLGSTRPIFGHTAQLSCRAHFSARACEGRGRDSAPGVRTLHPSASWLAIETLLVWPRLST